MFNCCLCFRFVCKFKPLDFMKHTLPKLITRFFQRFINSTTLSVSRKQVLQYIYIKVCNPIFQETSFSTKDFKAHAMSVLRRH